jgi:hypothetical protein
MFIPIRATLFGSSIGLILTCDAHACFCSFRVKTLKALPDFNWSITWQQEQAGQPNPEESGFQQK